MAVIDYVKDAAESLSSINPVISRLLIAVVILLIGFIAGRILGKLIYRVLHEVELDKHTQKQTGIGFSLEKLISSITAYFIYIIAVIMALNTAGISTFILNIAITIIILIFAVSFMLAVKDFLPNLLAGISIKKKKPFKEGDIIEVKGVKGRVVKLNLLDTELMTRAKDHIYFPNAVFSKSEVRRIK